MLIALKEFFGIAPKMDPRLLPDQGAQIALDVDFRFGTLVPFKLTAFDYTPTKAGTKKTIYRFGQNLASDTLYWFHWTDDVDVCKGQIAGDAAERTYFSGDTSKVGPQQTDNAIALTGGTNYPMASYNLGVPAPGTAPAGTISGVGTGVVESRSYVYTYVTAYGEEGMPSPPTALNAQDGQVANFTGLLAAPVGYNIVGKRMYRTISGTSGSVGYQYVADIPNATTVFADNLLAIQLGETMSTTFYAPPPIGLVGLINLPNGMMAGFVGNDVYNCEPYKGYAWPVQYIQSFAFPVVGLGYFGQTIVVCTTGQPSILYGTNPGTLQSTQIYLREGCVSKRSVVSMGIAVCYASNNGIVVIDSTGARVGTLKIINKEFWRALKPSSMICARFDGKYIGFYNNGTTQGGFVYDPMDPNSPFTMIDLYATAVYLDPVSDALFLQVGNDIVKWEGSTNNMTLTWHSKIFETQRPENPGWAKVVATSYPLTFKLFGDGNQVWTQTVLNRKPFRLPSGYMAQDWEVEIVANVTVQEVFVVSNLENLKEEND